MILLILIILITFSFVWFLVWFWFFKNEKISAGKTYKLGKKAFKKGDYKKAKEAFLQMPEIDLNQDAKYKLGVSYLNLGEYEEAKTCFEKVLKSSPQNVDAMFNLVNVLQLQNKYDEALEISEKAIKENSKDINIYLSIGNIYYKKGNYEKALEILEQAREINPENEAIAFAIIKCKSEIIDVEDEESYKKIIEEFYSLEEKGSLLPEFNISFAKIYAKNGHIDNAVAYCRKAIELKDSDIEAYRLLGLIQLIQKDLAGAKNSLSIALNLKPSSVETHDIFSYLLCNQDEHCERENCRKKYYKLIEKYLK